jgi:hypothetical protein
VRKYTSKDEGPEDVLNSDSVSIAVHMCLVSRWAHIWKSLSRMAAISKEGHAGSSVKRRLRQAEFSVLGLQHI